jgi:uncharacterized protein YjbI with pentapeptide repeats
MGRMGEMQRTIEACQDVSPVYGPLREVPSDRWEDILGAHQQWVESRGTAGEPADLTGANLQGRDLSRRNLCGARLCGANLQGATLYGTSFREADLQAADLSGATGLVAEQLAGANMRHTVLPKEVLQDDHLATVAEMSRSAQTLLLSTLGACIYGWLTIWTTTDTGLLTNRTTSTLPIIGGTIPIGVFLVIMPLVLLALYVYLHLHLQHLWEGVARLPAVFPDGRPLDRRVDLGLLGSFPRTYWVHLRDGSGGPATLSLLHKSFAILLVWGGVPLTLIPFWGRYLAAHNPYGTIFHLGLLVTAIGAGIGFRHLMAVTLSGQPAKSTGWKGGLAVVVGSGALLALLSCGAIWGIPADQYTRAEADEHWPAPGIPSFTLTDIQIAVPWIFDKVGVTPFADFEKEVLVAPRPPSWTGEKNAEIAGVEAVNLRGRRLQRAKAYRAFLAGADMRWADLTGANLREAALHGANLEGAWLGGANLRWTKFRWIRLLDATLTGAALVGADLREADLRRADLRWANLTLADLRGANLQAADLRWANLGDANLQKQMEPPQAVTSQTVAPSDGGFESTGQSTNLRGADLSWATLTQASLQEADLREAKLQGPIFSGPISRERISLAPTCGRPTFRRPNCRALIS